MSVAEFLHRQMAIKGEQVSPIRVYKHPFRLTRDMLAELFATWDFKNGAEIGVRAGKFSEVLCKAIPGLNLICVDPWSTGDFRSKTIGQEQQDQYYRECVERLKPYSAQIMRTTSMEAVREIPDGSLDFVYIDGNHQFDWVMSDIIWWARKVRTDGIVAGHDLYKFKRAGVVEAVEIYTRMHKIHEWFMTDEKEPTWFWANVGA